MQENAYNIKCSIGILILNINMDFLEFSHYDNFLGESYNHVNGGSC